MLGLNQIKIYIYIYINNKFNNPIPYLSIEQNKIVIINYTLLNLLWLYDDFYLV